MRRSTLVRFFSDLSRDVFLGQLSASVLEDQSQRAVEVNVAGVNRNYWLETSRRFGISHGGGGGDFALWIDIVVANDLACEFKGTIRDEADDIRMSPRPHCYRTFESYCREILRGIGLNDQPQEMLLRWHMQERVVFAPAAFRFDTGPRVYAKYEPGLKLVLSETPFETTTSRRPKKP